MIRQLKGLTGSSRTITNQEAIEKEDSQQCICPSYTKITKLMTNARTRNEGIPRLVPSTRFALALLVGFGLFIQYAQRLSMSIAIVCMVDRNDSNTEFVSTNHFFRNSTAVAESSIKIGTKLFKEKHFRWTELQQQLILGAYWAGYIITLVPGGWLSMKIGAKRVYTYFLSMSTAATLALTLIYLLPETHFMLVLILRVITGLGHGALFPATYTIWVLWAVPDERSTLTALSFSGTHIGTSTMMLLGGILCRYVSSGWMYIFIISSIFGFIWLILWLWLVSDSPMNNRKINKNERDYICSLIDQEAVSKKTRSITFFNLPWKNIIRSKPIMALFATHSCNIFGLFFFYTSIGKLLTEIHHVPPQNTGYILAGGFIIMAGCSVSSGILADHLVHAKIMTLTNVRKLFNSLTSFIPALCMIAFCFCDGTRQPLGIITVIIFLASSGFGYGSGYIVNFADLVPIYSSILFGLSITLGSLASLGANIIAGFIIKQPILNHWRRILIIFVVVYVIGGVIYLLFGSAVPQNLTKSVSQEKQEKNETDEEQETMPMQEASNA